MSPGPSALLSAMSCDTVGLCGNCDKHGGSESRPKYEAVKQSPSRAIIINPPSPQAMLRHRAQAVAWHAAWCKARCRCQSNLGRGWCKTQNAHEARPRPSFRGQKAVAHVVWTQIPSTVLPPGQMAKCENRDSVHWQRQQSSVQVREPETGVEKVKRKWLQRTGPQV